jgi:hypothetical protein
MSESDKIQAIYEGVQDLKVNLAKYEVRQDQHRTELDALRKETDELKKNQYKAIGGLTLLGLIATAFFTWLFKHI